MGNTQQNLQNQGSQQGMQSVNASQNAAQLIIQNGQQIVQPIINTNQYQCVPLNPSVHQMIAQSTPQQSYNQYLPQQNYNQNLPQQNYNQKFRGRVSLEEGVSIIIHGI